MTTGHKTHESHTSSAAVPLDGGFDNAKDVILGRFNVIGCNSVAAGIAHGDAAIRAATVHNGIVTAAVPTTTTTTTTARSTIVIGSLDDAFVNQHCGDTDECLPASPGWSDGRPGGLTREPGKLSLDSSSEAHAADSPTAAAAFAGAQHGSQFELR